jgi:tetratricopeptide (TPR) repeat protein
VLKPLVSSLLQGPVVFVLCALACGLGCAAGPKLDVQQSERHYDLAADYLGKKMISASLRECEQALHHNPGFAEAHFLYGAIKMGIAVQEIEMVARTSCVNPSSAALGRTQAEEKLREALKHFQKAVELRADYSEALDGLAAIELHFRNFDAALVAELRALKNPVFAENHIARSNLAWAYFGKSDLVRAELELRASIARQPEFCVGYYRLAEVLHQRGDSDGALDALAEIERRKSSCNIQEAFLLLGRIATARREPVRALRAFESCQLLAPRSCMATDCKKLALTLPAPPPRDGTDEPGASGEEG